MTALQRAKTLAERLGLWATLITFVLGFLINWGISAVTYANRVDFLTQKVAEQSVKIDKLGDKLDARDEQTTQSVGNNGNRITALEVKVFGRPQK